MNINSFLDNYTSNIDYNLYNFNDTNLCIKNGLVGIGTTEPKENYKLTIKGDVLIDGNLYAESNIIFKNYPKGDINFKIYEIGENNEKDYIFNINDYKEYIEKINVHIWGGGGAGGILNGNNSEYKYLENYNILGINQINITIGKGKGVTDEETNTGDNGQDTIFHNETVKGGTGSFSKYNEKGYIYIVYDNTLMKIDLDKNTKEEITINSIKNFVYNREKGYTILKNGTFYEIDLENFEITNETKIEIDGTNFSESILYENDIYISSDTYLYKIDINGILHWRHKLDININITPYIYGDYIYVVNNNTLYKIDRNNAVIINETDNIEEIKTKIVSDDRYIYLGDETETIYRIRLEDLVSEKIYKIRSDENIIGEIIVSDNDLYITSNKRLYKINKVFDSNSTTYKDFELWVHPPYENYWDSNVYTVIELPAWNNIKYTPILSNDKQYIYVVDTLLNYNNNNKIIKLKTENFNNEKIRVDDELEITNHIINKGDIHQRDNIIYYNTSSELIYFNTNKLETISVKNIGTNITNNIIINYKIIDNSEDTSNLPENKLSSELFNEITNKFAGKGGDSINTEGNNGLVVITWENEETLYSDKKLYFKDTLICNSLEIDNTLDTKLTYNWKLDVINKPNEYNPIDHTHSIELPEFESIIENKTNIISTGIGNIYEKNYTLIYNENIGYENNNIKISPNNDYLYIRKDTNIFEKLNIKTKELTSIDNDMLSYYYNVVPTLINITSNEPEFIMNTGYLYKDFVIKMNTLYVLNYHNESYTLKVFKVDLINKTMQQLCDFPQSEYNNLEIFDTITINNDETKIYISGKFQIIEYDIINDTKTVIFDNSDTNTALLQVVKSRYFYNGYLLFISNENSGIIYKYNINLSQKTEFITIDDIHRLEIYSGGPFDILITDDYVYFYYYESNSSKLRLYRINIDGSDYSLIHEVNTNIRNNNIKLSPKKDYFYIRTDTKTFKKLYLDTFNLVPFIHDDHNNIYNIIPYYNEDNYNEDITYYYRSNNNIYREVLKKYEGYYHKDFILSKNIILNYFEYSLTIQEVNLTDKKVNQICNFDQYNDLDTFNTISMNEDETKLYVSGKYQIIEYDKVNDKKTVIYDNSSTNTELNPFIKARYLYNNILVLYSNENAGIIYKYNMNLNEKTELIVINDIKDFEIDIIVSPDYIYVYYYDNGYLKLYKIYDTNFPIFTKTLGGININEETKYQTNIDIINLNLKELVNLENGLKTYVRKNDDSPPYTGELQEPDENIQYHANFEALWGGTNWNLYLNHFGYFYTNEYSGIFTFQDRSQAKITLSINETILFDSITRGNTGRIIDPTNGTTTTIRLEAYTYYRLNMKVDMTGNYQINLGFKLPNETEYIYNGLGYYYSFKDVDYSNSRDISDMIDIMKNIVILQYSKNIILKNIRILQNSKNIILKNIRISGSDESKLPNNIYIYGYKSYNNWELLYSQSIIFYINTDGIYEYISKNINIKNKYSIFGFYTHEINVLKHYRTGYEINLFGKEDDYIDIYLDDIKYGKKHIHPIEYNNNVTLYYAGLPNSYRFVIEDDIRCIKLNDTQPNNNEYPTIIETIEYGDNGYMFFDMDLTSNFTLSFWYKNNTNLANPYHGNTTDTTKEGIFCIRNIIDTDEDKDLIKITFNETHLNINFLQNSTNYDISNMRTNHINNYFVNIVITYNANAINPEKVCNLIIYKEDSDITTLSSDPHANSKYNSNEKSRIFINRSYIENGIYGFSYISDIKVFNRVLSDDEILLNQKTFNNMTKEAYEFDKNNTIVKFLSPKQYTKDLKYYYSINNNNIEKKLVETDENIFLIKFDMNTKIGNIYLTNEEDYIYATFNEENIIRKINIKDGNSIIIGGNYVNGLKDGYNDNSLYDNPFGIWITDDDKYIYIADRGNKKIRRIFTAYNRFYELRKDKTLVIEENNIVNVKDYEDYIIYEKDSEYFKYDLFYNTKENYESNIEENISFDNIDIISFDKIEGYNYIVATSTEIYSYSSNNSNLLTNSFNNIKKIKLSANGNEVYVIDDNIFIKKYDIIKNTIYDIYQNNVNITNISLSYDDTILYIIQEDGLYKIENINNYFVSKFTNIFRERGGMYGLINDLDIIYNNDDEKENKRYQYKLKLYNNTNIENIYMELYGSNIDGIKEYDKIYPSSFLALENNLLFIKNFNSSFNDPLNEDNNLISNGITEYTFKFKRYLQNKNYIEIDECKYEIPFLILKHLEIINYENKSYITNPNIYNSFTGYHFVTTNESIIKKGYIISATGKYQDINKYYDSNNIIDNIRISQALPIVEYSKKEKDKKCFGVVNYIENIDDKIHDLGFNKNFITVKKTGDERLIVNSIGEGSIWVSNYNGPLENGDFITTSPIPGIGMKQDEDYITNYTVGKITMDCDFNPKKIEVKRSLELYRNGILNNILDKNENIIYENTGIIEDEYKIENIDINGNIREDGEYKMAFVGCTYHCG
jgi:hypothetical protein